MQVAPPKLRELALECCLLKKTGQENVLNLSSHAASHTKCKFASQVIGSHAELV